VADSKSFWDERFGQSSYVYGESPNAYLKSKLSEMKTGKILFPCEGEGRNAVYAATLGWDVFAFDQSLEGKKKAAQLALKHSVQLEYSIDDIAHVNYTQDSFDSLALIFAHFPSSVRRQLHRKLAGFLKKGGFLILEGFDKGHKANQQTNPKAGGPADVDMLFDIQELKEDFENFEFIEAETIIDTLHEGDYHVGISNLTRIFAIKK